jgi:aminoglycoside phosphotransferase (APT) family kinase protein
MPNTDKVHIDVSLVRRLITTQFPPWADLPIKPVESAGTSHTLYRLGDERVVRLPRTPSAYEQVDKEQRWLPRIAPFLPLSIPYPLAAGTPGEGYPWHWSVYPWLVGKDASITPVADAHQTAVALAEFLLALHQIDPMDGPSPGKHNFFRGEPLAMRDGETRAAIASLHAKFDTDLVVEVWKCSLEAPAWGDPPCWIHGDLIPTNLLIHDGRLSAVIDFGGLGVGDPACDLLVAWTFLSAEAREVFRSALAVDDATWARGRGWALSFGLIAFEYYQESNLILSRIAKRSIEEVLAEYKTSERIIKGR